MPFYANNSTPDEGLLISGNYLLPISYLPTHGEVLGSLIDEPIDYCGVEWLSQFWPMDLVWDANKVCFCESLGEWWRENNKGEKSIGLFQINMLAHKGFSVEYLKVPENNVKEAIKIYNDGSKKWRHWYNCAVKVGIIN